MTEISHNDKPTLVLGGTGKTGRRVVDRLGARGLPVRVGSRSGQPPFDWADQSTWAPVLQGVRAVYIPYPDLVVPEATEGRAGVRRARDRARRHPAGDADRPRRGRGPAGRA